MKTLFLKTLAGYGYRLSGAKQRLQQKYPFYDGFCNKDLGSSFGQNYQFYFVLKRLCLIYFGVF